MSDVYDGRPDQGAMNEGEAAEASRAEGASNHGEAQPTSVPNLASRAPGAKRKTRRTVQAPTPKNSFTPEQRLLILDTWQRSGLPATDFAPLVGVSKHSLYTWRKKFNEQGPAGLDDKPKGAKKGSRISEPTKRAILMMKRSNPDWGCERIHDMLLRTEGYQASPNAIQRILIEEGYVVEETPTRAHPDKVRSFERARPNQLWQTDLFTFVLKRENRRVHLVGFMDDHSRFIVGFGLHASASGAMVRETFEAAIVNFGAPKEVLTDNGTQYHTWRGKSAFAKLCEKRGIKQIVSRPRHPQTLGKIERFWGTLWRECVETAIFRGLDDARERIGHFIDHYNFQRTHQGIDGLVPADRYFSAAPEVRQTLQQRVEANALDLARHGTPRKPFYLTGRVGDSSISLHGEGDRVILTSGGKREEVDLAAPGRRRHPEEMPASSTSTQAAPTEESADASTDETEEEPEAEDVPTDTEAMENGEGHEPVSTAIGSVINESPSQPASEAAPAAPGTSPLDSALEQLKRLRHGGNGEPEGNAYSSTRESTDGGEA